MDFFTNALTRDFSGVVLYRRKGKRKIIENIMVS